MTIGSGLPIRARVTLAVMTAAILPVAALGTLLVLAGYPDLMAAILLMLVLAALVGILVAAILVSSLTRPLRALEEALEKATQGSVDQALLAFPEDELGRLAERQAALAADLLRRNLAVARVVAAVAAWTPADGTDLLVEQAARDARSALGLVDASIILGDPSSIGWEERVPGDPLPVRAVLQAGHEPVGLLAGHAPATARWERADQDLLELFATSVAVGIRDADLLARVAAQNEQLLALDVEKDDFLRGVSHNLQTPLARIRAYADHLASDRPDERLAIIVEQSDRLSRMVRQLLLASRLESGVVSPVAEVFALGPRVRRGWEALGAAQVAFSLVDETGGWLAVADPDQVEQLIWALLDNAVKYGGGEPVEATLRVDRERWRVRLTIADHGPGIRDGDRERLFTRYGRGSQPEDRDGSGLGLYVGRALAVANGGDLVLEAGGPALGATFTLELPGEAPTEA